MVFNITPLIIDIKFKSTMAIFTPFSTQDEESDNCSIYHLNSLFSSPKYDDYDCCQFQYNESIMECSKYEFMCPKCHKGTMEIYRISIDRYGLMCNDKTNKERDICLYPLDSKDLNNFIGNKGESKEELYERTRAFVINNMPYDDYLLSSQ